MKPERDEKAHTDCFIYGEVINHIYLKNHVSYQFLRNILQ